ncbi:heterogeneous nuclear ribonucleoprotein 1-like [Quillaja saponaria]|uniref:Heterogeneous nuclear ribonucleoprotein 1-like n=1 Tax=Quillaja saponaria TaxID=32244 RepID=A0AAD7M0Q7_QUISA|nr:heterogeneous nuclear ribonucleoprotein 1-like [Quillaja saponaria]
MEMESGKLFIGGISWDTNEDRLRQYFQTFGDVVEAVIMKDRGTGRARGFGFIVFADPAIAELVVKEKHIIDGRAVEAKKAVPRDDQNTLTRSNSSVQGSPCPGQTKKIFVGGLASTVTENDFKNYFDQFGTITDVVVMYDHNTQRPRGFGFITYDSEEAVEQVLYKTFHELNGKMVEVKRAVPKELSSGPSRGQLGGYNSSPSRVSSFLDGYIQGYSPSLIGGHGLKMDGRFSPGAVGRSAYTPISPSYGTGLNFVPASSQGGNANLRALNTPYSGNSNRYSNAIGYGGFIGANNSDISLTSHNLWGNGSLNHAMSSTNSNAFAGYGTENSSLGSFGTIGGLWSLSRGTGQVGGAGSTYTSGHLSYGNNNKDVNFGSGVLSYGRNSGATAAPLSSFAASNGSYGGAYADNYEAGSFYGDSTWRSSPSEVEDSGSLGYGLGNAASDFTAKNSVGYIGAYGVANRQSNSEF